jgi:hypothetical protein
MMKYDEQKFISSVEEYKKILGNVKSKSFLIVFKNDDKNAFFSLAPLSRAIHELGGDVHATAIGNDTGSLEAVKEVWNTYEKVKDGSNDIKSDALKSFISVLEKKEKGVFQEIFDAPDFIIEAGNGGFSGGYALPYMPGWFKEHRIEEIKQTCNKIWKDVYNLKDFEKISIGFVLVEKDDLLGHPIEDYLDSYAICWNMNIACNGSVNMSASSQRKSMLEKGEDISELKAVLLGCELCKEVDEEPFITYKELSKILALDRIKTVDASFFIAGKGYHGKHYFGEIIGYPSRNKKTRWQSPGQMVYKLDFYPQTGLDDRDPIARVGFTETLPLDIFIDTCNIDWAKMRERNYKVKEIADKCKLIKIIGEEINGLKTDFEVGLVKDDGTHRWVRTSDTDIREKINSEYLRRTGIKGGNMANLPGGEAFVTPEYVKGTIVGDVVISIDQSYRLSADEPFVIEASGNEYNVVSGPKKILDKFNEKKNEAWEGIMNQEKYKSLPQDLIDMKKKNFNMINEFAINTNPVAKLCDYLIVNEKIARMIHVAMGSGFEPDRATDYHTDVVINSPRQKLDIYGIDKDGNEQWIIKKGEFVA